jgi:anthranilate phosphoribosyltransferase
MSSNTHLLHELTVQCQAGQALSPDQIEAVVEALVEEVDDLEPKAAFLQAFTEKGETSAEIGVLVKSLLAKAVRPEIDYREIENPVIDVVGTGGDKLGLFNVSTASMFVIAAGGVGIIKHGNRAITSKAGGADVLEMLGVSITLGPEDLLECFRRTGMAFVFAPNYHPAFKAIGPVRRLLGERGKPTVFNKLGPLLNPLQPPFQLAGVFAEPLMQTYAEVLAGLGRESAWVVHGRVTDANGAELGADELTQVGRNLVQEVRGGQFSAAHELDAAAYAGFQPSTLEQLQGAGGPENAAILRGILDGTDQGPRRETVLLNAAAGLVVAGRAATLEEGLDRTGELIDNGAALAKLEAFSTFRPR